MGHVPEMLLYTKDPTLFANLYSELTGTVSVAGVAVKVSETTDYPSFDDPLFTPYALGR